MKLDNPELSDDALIDFMIAHPIVVTPTGTKLCRPSELVLDILPLPHLKELTKEDGERVIDTEGRRVSNPN